MTTLWEKLKKGEVIYRLDEQSTIDLHPADMMQYHHDCCVFSEMIAGGMGIPYVYRVLFDQVKNKRF